MFKLNEAIWKFPNPIEPVSLWEGDIWTQTSTKGRWHEDTEEEDGNFKSRRKAWHRFFPHGLQKDSDPASAWSWTWKHQKCEKINFYYLSHPTCGTCYGSPEFALNKPFLKFYIEEAHEQARQLWRNTGALKGINSSLQN